MNMVKILVTSTSLLYALQCLQCQPVTDTVRLFDCYRLARQNAPQLQQLDINQRQFELETSRINKSNLPVVTGFGKATYQSDAVAITAGTPPRTTFALDLFQYNAGIGIDQKLFDGGMSALRKDLQAIWNEVKDLETESQLYKYNELVNKYFFGFVSLQKSIGILNLRSATLTARKQALASGVANGMVLPADIYRLEAEILASRQQIAELGVAADQMNHSLKVLTGLDSAEHIVWKYPDTIALADTTGRYETLLFEKQRRYSDALAQMQGRRYMPQISAFGQVGYSYPGLNFYDNAAAGYYLAGVRLSWQIFDWQLAKTDKQLTGLQKEQINIAETDFRRNLAIAIASERLKIDNVRQLLADDRAVIAVREQITRAGASQLDNGTITSADYISDLNAELKARLDYELHLIALAESSARLAVLQGIVVF